MVILKAKFIPDLRRCLIFKLHPPVAINMVSYLSLQYPRSGSLDYISKAIKELFSAACILFEAPEVGHLDEKWARGERS